MTAQERLFEAAQLVDRVVQESDPYVSADDVQELSEIRSRIMRFRKLVKSREDDDRAASIYIP